MRLTGPRKASAMIRTIRTTVRHLQVGDTIVPKRGDGHGLSGRVLFVMDVGGAVGVRTTEGDRAVKSDVPVSVRRTIDPRPVQRHDTPADKAACHTLEHLGGTFD